MALPLWFQPASLRALCDAGAWARGMALFRDGHVRRLQIEPQDGHWRLEGEVLGSQRTPYAVAVELGLMPDGEVDFWHGHCTCPVGRQCKHGVALVAQAAHRGAPSQALRPGWATPGARRSAVRQAEQGRIAEVQRLEAEAQLVNWLLALERAGEPASAQAGDERPDQYLYLLSLVGTPRAAPRLQLEAVVSYPKVTGGWAKPRPLRTPPAKGQALYDRASEDDRQVLQLLRAMPHSQAYYSAYSAAPCAVLEGQVGLMAVQQAAGTGRLFADAGGTTVGAALRWGAPQALAWDWQAAPAAPGAGAGAGEGWALRARLPSPTATLCLNSPPVYLDAAQGLCGPVHAEGLAPAQLELLLKAPPFSADALRRHQGDVALRLGAAVPLPPLLQGLRRLEGVAPVACLHLAPVPAAEVPSRGLIGAQLCFDYQGLRGWWAEGAPWVELPGADGPVLLRRDAGAEHTALAGLQALGLADLGGGCFGIPGGRPQHDWMHWADNGFAVLRDAGFAVTTDRALDGWITHAPAVAVRLEAQGGDGAEAASPWFALSLGVEIHGQRHDILPWLPELIAAAAELPPDPATGLPTLPPHVYLNAPGGQGFVRLPTDALRPWMAALLELVGDRAHDFSRGALLLSRVDALRTSAALGEGATWEGAAALRGLARQLQGGAALPVAHVPASVRAVLRPYQQQGLNWLQFLRAQGLAGILADDMGLGKTLQTLVHIQVEKEAGRLTHPALIIAPVSLMGNWQREAERFCPGLRTLVLHGKERHGAADAMAAHDVVIAPYSLLQRDRERWLAAQWHLVVLDEAQYIRNASTHAAQVAASLQARHRLCLSGTPMENHLGEIWSLFHFLMPGFLGSQQRFKELFRTPIEKQGDGERLAQLRARVTPFMLRRTKALVAHELPPKVETVMRVELAGRQADLYETIRLGMEKTVREALGAKGLARSQVTILDALLKLRQVCCDPRLVPLEAARRLEGSAKLEQLMELLPGMLAEGRRILLFSQFTSMLALIEAELKQRGLAWTKLTGQSRHRDEAIARFTSGQVPLFLISLKAGGVGLNLPQADTVIHYDPWWNPATEAQATDRAHRIGQTQSVWVLKMVAQGTIEERILALQERKAQLAGGLYSGAAGRKEPLFTEGDLAELLKPLS